MTHDSDNPPCPNRCGRQGVVRLSATDCKCNRCGRVFDFTTREPPRSALQENATNFPKTGEANHGR